MGASGLVIGSGAFASANAERSVSVSVVDDDEAFLALEDVGSGGRSVMDGGKLRFSIPGAFEESDGAGVGTDSVYWFGQDAASNENGLFTVENLGTQPVVVYSTQSNPDGVPSVTMYDVEMDEILTENDPSEPLGVGDQLRAGLQIDTHDVPIREEEYNVAVSINALATDPA